MGTSSAPRPFPESDGRHRALAGRTSASSSVAQGSGLSPELCTGFSTGFPTPPQKHYRWRGGHLGRRVLIENLRWCPNDRSVARTRGGKLGATHRKDTKNHPVEGIFDLFLPPSAALVPFHVKHEQPLSRTAKISCVLPRRSSRKCTVTRAVLVGVLHKVIHSNIHRQIHSAAGPPSCIQRCSRSLPFPYGRAWGRIPEEARPTFRGQQQRV